MSKSTKKSSSKKTIKRPVKASSKPSQKTRKPSPKAIKQPKSTKASAKFRSPVPRSASNPFREGSSYGIAFDILAAHPEGLPREELIAELSQITKKPLKNAGYDAVVVLSPTESGKRHSSCRGTYTVEKTNDHCKLRTE